MKRLLTNFVLLSTLVVCAAYGQATLGQAAFAQTSTLQRVNAVGGVLSIPAVHGNYMYVGTGVTITVWDMSDPTSPVLAGRTNRTPELGSITGLTMVGDYLYAGWNG